MFLSGRNPQTQDKQGGKASTGLLGRLRRGLARTRAGLTDRLGGLFGAGRAIDEELLEELETLLLSADVGVEATSSIISDLSKRISRRQLNDAKALLSALQDEMLQLLEPVAQPLELPRPGTGPYVILVVGVNGSGKTTTIGKLAGRFGAEGRSVMLAAGDTFRAAAVEQLQVWGRGHDVPVIAQQPGADSASVVYDALQAARARDMDVLLADTAGRLHTHGNLMEELRKVGRVLAKLDPAAPHEVLLVLDAGTGQNALNQATQFKEAVGVTGLALTKLDGTAKGGIVFAIAKKTGLPIRFIGVGEAAEDLRPFDAREFVEALLQQ